jgi:hypothetical protein
LKRFSGVQGAALQKSPLATESIAANFSNFSKNHYTSNTPIMQLIYMFSFTVEIWGNLGTN